MAGIEEKVDFLNELTKRNCNLITDEILSYVAVVGRVAAAHVSTDWKDIVEEYMVKKKKTKANPHGCQILSITEITTCNLSSWTPSLDDWTMAYNLAIDTRDLGFLKCILPFVGDYLETMIFRAVNAGFREFVGQVIEARNLNASDYSENMLIKPCENGDYRMLTMLRRKLGDCWMGWRLKRLLKKKNTLSTTANIRAKALMTVIRDGPDYRSEEEEEKDYYFDEDPYYACWGF